MSWRLFFMDFLSQRKVRIRLLFILTIVLFPSVAKAMGLVSTLKYSVDHSPIILESYSDIETGKAKLELAKSASRPKISVSGGYIVMNKPASMEIPSISLPMLGSLNLGGMDLTKEHLAIGMASVVYPVYTGGRISHAKNEAKSLIKASENASEEVKLEVGYGALKAYLGLLLAQENLDVRRQYSETVAEHVKNAKKLFEQKQIAKYDVMRAEAEYENSLSALKEAENKVELTKSLLLNIIGAEEANFEFDDIDKCFLFEDLKYKKVDELFENALINSSKIKALEAKLNIYTEGKKKAKADKAPIVSLFDSQIISNEQPMKMPNQIAGVLVNIPVYDGGESKAKIDEKISLIKKTETEIVKAKNDLRYEIETYLSDISSAESVISSADKSIEVSREGLRLAERRFNECVGSGIEVKDASIILSGAELYKFSALYKYRVALCGLAKTQGRFWELTEK